MGFIKKDNQKSLKEYQKNVLNTEIIKRNHPDIVITDKKPIYVKSYYNINRTASTVSQGTGRIEEYIGNNSPLRFNKINGLVLYGYTAEERSSEMDETVGEVVVEVFTSELPAYAFEPTEGDYLTLEVDDATWLYVVTDTFDLDDLDKTRFQITYRKIANNKDDKYSLIEKQVVSESVFTPENIGTTLPLLVDINAYNESVDKLNIIRELTLEYVSAFYDVTANAIMCYDKKLNRKMYSIMLTEFISRNKILFLENDNMEIILTQEVLLPDNLDNMYLDSIFGNISRLDISTLQSKKLIGLDYNTESNPFSHLYQYMHNIINIEDCDDSNSVLCSLYPDRIFSLYDNYNNNLKIAALINSAIDFNKVFMNKDDILCCIRNKDIEAMYLVPFIIYKYKNAANESLGMNVNEVLVNIFGI